MSIQMRSLEPRDALDFVEFFELPEGRTAVVACFIVQPVSPSEAQ